MDNNLKNFIVSIHGRGASYCCLMQNLALEEVVSLCQRPVGCGFEVYIYSIEPNPLGTAGFIPDKAINLKRHFHLYDAHAEFEDEATSIVNKLSAHSVEASIDYVNLMINILNREKENLNEQMPRVQAPPVQQSQPTTDMSTMRPPEQPPTQTPPREDSAGSASDVAGANPTNG